MMLPIVNNTEELITQVNNNELYVKLVNQINKDFNLIGLTMAIDITKPLWTTSP